MTDNEIIKALTYCCLDMDEKDLIDKDNGCQKRLCYQVALSETSVDTTMCRQRLINDALDLINRQKAEIERLEEENAKQKVMLGYIEDEMFPLPFGTDFDKAIKTAKSEAIKEFVEKLKENVHCTDSWGNIVTVNCIDDFVKEMTDVKEIQHGYNATDKHPVDEFVCSVCGFACQDFTEIVTDEDRDDTWHRECEFSYCPHCGAKMDKE